MERKKLITKQGYTFLDDTTRAEFIAVKQPSNTNYWGSVYSSDFDVCSLSISIFFTPTTTTKGKKRERQEEKGKERKGKKGGKKKLK